MAEPLPRFPGFAGQVPTPEEFAAAASFEMAFAHLLRDDIPRCRQALAEAIAHGARHPAVEELIGILDRPDPFSHAISHLLAHSWLVPLSFRVNSLEIALRLLLMGQFERAEKVLEFATPRNPMALTPANRVKRRGDVEAVLAALHPLLERPEYPRLRALYVDVLETEPDVAAYITAIDRIVGPAEERFQDIRWLSLQNLRGHAASVVEAVRHLYTSRPDVHISRLMALVLIELGQFEEAEAVLHKAEESFPAWFFAPVRALAALYRNDLVEAERQLGRFKQTATADHFAAVVNLMVLGRQERWREAKEAVAAAVATVRNDVRLLVSQSVIHRRLGNQAAATEADTCAQSVDPAWCAAEHARWRRILGE